MAIIKLDTPEPIAIGGVGGSGTRVIADLFMELGYHLGLDINHSLDNLWFTLLFKYREALYLNDLEFFRCYEIFRNAMLSVEGGSIDSELRQKLLSSERDDQHNESWLIKRLASISSIDTITASKWGWKEPNTHIFIDRIFSIDKSINYIHVMRNGLDMAYSQNQNQLRLWGSTILGEAYENSPRGSLRFWCQVHKRIQKTNSLMGQKFLLINFDELCKFPHEELQKILNHFKIRTPNYLLEKLTKRIKQPASIGRHRLNTINDFDKDDIEFVEYMGFHIY